MSPKWPLVPRANAPAMAADPGYAQVDIGGTPFIFHPSVTFGIIDSNNDSGALTSTPTTTKATYGARGRCSGWGPTIGAVNRLVLQWSSKALLFVLVAMAALLAPARPVDATQVDATSLRTAWKSTKETPADDTPCNYIYVDEHYNLIYYGTSSKCSTRIVSHIYYSKGSYDMLEHIVTQVPQAYVATIINSTLDWTLLTNRNGTTQGNGTSDTCLGIVQAASALSIWYLPLKTKSKAEDVEKCVLAKSVGFCNRQGMGSTKGSWLQFQSSVASCSS
jgi:hypothetical protein